MILWAISIFAAIAFGQHANRCPVSALPSLVEPDMSGTNILNNLKKLPANQVEQAIENYVYRGHIPNFLRRFVPVEVNCGVETIKFWVSPDYLSLGTDSDYFRLKLGARRAQNIADKLGMVLPTAAIVQLVHLEAKSNNTAVAGRGMRDTQTVCRGDLGMQKLECLEHYEKNVILPKVKSLALGTLVSGFKKDIVVPPKNRPPERVSIFGFSTNATDFPIQDGFGPHPQWYSDYSHGVRFVDPNIEVNGQRMTMERALSDGRATCLFSNWLGTVTEMQAVFPVRTAQGVVCKN